MVEGRTWPICADALNAAGDQPAASVGEERLVTHKTIKRLYEKSQNTDSAEVRAFTPRGANCGRSASSPDDYFDVSGLCWNDRHYQRRHTDRWYRNGGWSSIDIWRDLRLEPGDLRNEFRRRHARMHWS